MTAANIRRTYLLSILPVLLSTKKLAGLFEVNLTTMQKKLKSGDLPFKNVSISKRDQQFLAVEVVDYLLETTEKNKKRRSVGSKNRPKEVQTQAWA